MSFPRYGRYKESGVAWLGEVPEEWEVRPGRRMFRQKRERAFASDEQLSATQKYGVIPQKLFMEHEDQKVVLALKGTDAFKHVEADDFVISLRSFQGGLERSRYSGCVSTAYTVLDGSKCDNTDFWAYLFKSAAYIDTLQSSTDGIREGKTISYDQFAAIGLPIPSAMEQVLIADFLDRETGKIDALVEEQRRLIELLKEKRQAVISHAVTKGLNPNAPMKDSGVEWIAHMPAHWSLVGVRRVLSAIEQGWSPECIARSADAEEWGVLKAGCVNRGVFNEAENKALPSALEPITSYEVRSGDVLMSRASGSPELVGSTALVSETRPRLMLSDKVFRIELEPEMHKRFFVAAFNSRFMRSQIEQALSGGEGLANNLPQSALKNFLIPLPPLYEQLTIASHTAATIASIAKLTDKAEHAIALLQERRSALISAAVTGKIDVRDHARRAAEEPEQAHVPA